MKKYVCECLGTAVLVLFGCGIAVLSGADLVATALAFGLAIVAMAYVIGNVSGCHVNPAVSLAMLINKKLTVKEFCLYVVSQVIGAFVGAGILYFVLSNAGIGVENLGANGFGTLSVAGAFVVELVLTFVFVYTILGVTSDESKASVAGIVIGLTLAFVHLLGIKLTGTSVNPARSLAPAVLQGGDALKQVWLFIVAPLCGGALSACTFKWLNKEEK
ncbi:MAG: aquaporin [Clostridia bacterium]|nr:aquaporin [Clostridia bacterium]